MPPWFHLPPPHPGLLASDKQASVAIIGAGLAGCWLSRQLVKRGVNVTLFDAADTVAAGPSGNPVGIVKPYVMRQPSRIEDFYRNAFRFLVRTLAADEELANQAPLHAVGVLQLVRQAYACRAGFESVTAEAATAIAGMAIESPALWFADAGWMNPSALCAALIDSAGITPVLNAEVTHIARDGNQWQLYTPGNDELFDIVVLCPGATRIALPVAAALPLVPARGQLSAFQLVHDATRPHCIINGKCYVVPVEQQLIIGATFERDNSNTDVCTVDDQINRQHALAMLTSLELPNDAESGFAAVRATSPDRLPLVGPLPDFSEYQKVYADLRHGRPADHYPDAPVQPHMHVLAGLGSRGLVTAPWCAELLAEYLCGQSTEQPLEAWLDLLHPARFTVRDLKRGRSERRQAGLFKA